VAVELADHAANLVLIGAEDAGDLGGRGPGVGGEQDLGPLS
jgi:hypothetical protein